MHSPITNALIKIFAKGFYRVNSGLLIFFCITIGSSFIFIETAGDVNLISSDQLTFYHFIMVITFISSPLMTGVMFFVWLAYALKSWSYIAGQLSLPSHQFLFYSITSTNKVRQFKCWFWIQAVIFIPVICYWLFAVGAGIVFHHYYLPVIILLYIFVLTGISAWLYTVLVNRLTDGNKQSYLIQLSSNWSKPFFSLFIYYLFDRMKLAYLITKAISLLTVIAVLNSFSDMNNDLRVAGIIILSVVTAHSFLIYQEHRFLETKMSFSRNLPYSRIKLFIDFTWIFLLLILPEIILLFTKFNPVMVVGLLLLGLSIALLFRSLLYWFGLIMFKYLRWIFGLYILMFMLIMYSLSWILIPFNLAISFMVFYRNYYNQEAELKS